jgi:choline dehydrogenase-like flavoprotein
MNSLKNIFFVFLLIFPFQLISKTCCNSNCSVDYIVVGIGNAGAVMCKLLTDDLKTSVIGLHTGDNLTQDPDIKLARNAPAVVVSALFGSPLYETGNTVPQINADSRDLMWVIANPLGGASSINAGAFCRGTNDIYAQWQALAGPNWSVDTILNVYKQLETYSGQTSNPDARGFNGPIPVRQAPQPTQVSLKFTHALINATGLPFIPDYNDPNTPTGASSQLQYTQSLPTGDLRASSATVFLNDAVMTPNGFGVNGRKLRVLFESTALRTIWRGNKAIGVEFLQNGQTKKVFARKGVIVCAGLFSSSFLMHSGIGDQAKLQSLGIPVKFNNPNVGQGFADHIRINLFFTTNPDDTPIPPVDPNNFLNQIAWLPDPLGDQSKRFFHFVTINPIPGFALGLLVLSPPFSRGTITINSADPLDPPVIDLGVLTDSRDLQLFQNILMITIKNLNAQLQVIDSDYELLFPSPSILNDVNVVTEFIRANVASNEHFQSHCRMAPLEQGGVVDSTGRVYGVKNLIVADDSVVPQCIDGSPMATAYLIPFNIAQMLIANG